jgi:hypothetical protein
MLLQYERAFATKGILTEAKRQFYHISVGVPADAKYHFMAPLKLQFQLHRWKNVHLYL